MHFEPKIIFSADPFHVLQGDARKPWLGYGPTHMYMMPLEDDELNLDGGRFEFFKTSELPLKMRCNSTKVSIYSAIDIVSTIMQYPWSFRLQTDQKLMTFDMMFDCNEALIEFRLRV
jgi:hypothetical protein